MKKNQSQVQGKETILGERPIRIYIYEALNRLMVLSDNGKTITQQTFISF
ncbi:PyrR protein [Hoylesella nanceiensis]|nr:PyrR protein [Hoylesella nanceiensis]MBF1427146.1 PyrR protein [Hoylesella nanceiensis]